MERSQRFAGLRAGVVLGMAAGFCFASAVFLLVHELRHYDPVWAGHPALVWLFGLVPLVWFVWGVQLLRRLEVTG